MNLANILSDRLQILKEFIGMQILYYQFYTKIQFYAKSKLKPLFIKKKRNALWIWQTHLFLRIVLRETSTRYKCLVLRLRELRASSLRHAVYALMFTL